MAKYQIIKHGDGRYSCGQLIPYFWSWHPGYFLTYSEALDELNKYIKEMEELDKRMKKEVVYEVEV